MSFLVHLASTVAKAINSILGDVVEAATKGVAPEENIYAVNANVEWGKQWLITALDILLHGGRPTITTIDVVMLAIFVASTVLARRMKAASSTVATANTATG